MTPQLASQPGVAACADLDSRHLTHLTEDQFGELLTDSPGPSGSDPGPNAALAAAHLLSCRQCAAELTTLRESLSLFREATNAYAGNELRRRPQMSLPTRRLLSPALEPAYWAAAAAIVLAAFLPMQFLRQHPSQPAPSVVASVADRSAQSDEALLEDVNREISASVPAPMQALADPTGGEASVDLDSSAAPSTQRKD
jgi:hypothetical protein